MYSNTQKYLKMDIHLKSCVYVLIHGFKNICLRIWLCAFLIVCVRMCFTVRLSAVQPLKLKVYEVLAVTSLTPDWPITLCADRAVSGGELGFGPTQTYMRARTHTHTHTHTVGSI